MKSSDEWIIEHFIFHALVRRYRVPAVGHTYLAIQWALSVNAPRVDVLPWVRGVIPDGYGGGSVYIGASGLAFFHFLFEVKLEHAGVTDYHQYKFTRRRDHASTIATVKSDSEPHDSEYRQRYDRQLKKVTAARDKILCTSRWYSTSELFKQAFPGVKIVEL